MCWLVRSVGSNSFEDFHIPILRTDDVFVEFSCEKDRALSNMPLWPTPLWPIPLNWMPSAFVVVVVESLVFGLRSTRLYLASD